MAPTVRPEWATCHSIPASTRPHRSIARSWCSAAPPVRSCRTGHVSTRESSARHVARPTRRGTQAAELLVQSSFNLDASRYRSPRRGSRAGRRGAGRNLRPDLAAAGSERRDRDARPLRVTGRRRRVPAHRAAALPGRPPPRRTRSVHAFRRRLAAGHDAAAGAPRIPSSRSTTSSGWPSRQGYSREALTVRSPKPVPTWAGTTSHCSYRPGSA